MNVAATTSSADIQATAAASASLNGSGGGGGVAGLRSVGDAHSYTGMPIANLTSNGSNGINNNNASSRNNNNNNNNRDADESYITSQMSRSSPGILYLFLFSLHLEK